MKFIKKILKAILFYFVSIDNEQKNVAKKKRRHVRDVKPGQSVRIEWHRIKGGIGYLKCLNNDPETKKIFLEVSWSNHKENGCEPKEQIILEYSSRELSNFYLLNPVAVYEKDKDDDDEDDEYNYDSDIAKLQKKMDEAIEKENYEEAEELQRKIDKLSKNK